MAIRVTITNTVGGATLATQDIPASALPAIQRAFPGTATEAATAALAFMLLQLRLRVQEVRHAIKQQEQQDLASAAVQADDADFTATEWAE